LIVDGLAEFTWHSVRVFGYSDQGKGVANPLIRVQTFENGMSLANLFAQYLAKLRHMTKYKRNDNPRDGKVSKTWYETEKPEDFIYSVLPLI